MTAVANRPHLHGCRAGACGRGDLLVSNGEDGNLFSEADGIAGAGHDCVVRGF